MTLAGILALAASFDAVDLDGVYSTGSIDWTTANTGVLVYASWSLRTIGKKIQQYDPKIGFTPVAETDTYGLRSSAFTRKVVMARRVIINGSSLYECDRQRYGLWSMAELERKVPNWMTGTSDIPNKAVQYGQSLILNPKPTQAVVDAGSCYVSGTYLPAAMAALTDVPDLPEELHEPLALLTRIRASYPAITEQEAWTRMSAINGEYREAVEEVASENAAHLTSWGSTAGERYPDAVWV